MKALIKSGNSQVWVEEGQEVLLDSPKVDEVLAISDGEKVTIGQPLVAGALPGGGIRRRKLVRPGTGRDPRLFPELVPGEDDPGRDPERR